MKFRITPTIRWQLLLLVLALAIPFLVFMWASFARQSALDREAEGQHLVGVARLTAARLDDHIGDIQQLLSVLSAAVGTTTGDMQRNDELLQGLATRLPASISNINIWTAKGENIGSLDTSFRTKSIDVLTRKFFHDALKSREMAVQAPVVSAASNELIGLFALQIERKGRVVGVVGAAVQLKGLQNLLAPKGTIRSTTVITVTDVSGVVLARSIDPEKWIGKNLLGGPGGLAESLQRREGVRDGPSAEGIVRIAGFTMTAKTPWLVYVGTPADVALAATRANLYGNIGAGLAMLVLGLLLATRLAQRISSPLRQLGVDASVLEKGDLSHRSRITGRGEVAVLASTLNRMADALQRRTASLEESHVRMRQLAEFDHLTGLPNRAQFLNRLDAAIARSAAEDTPMALLFLDIDHFKSVNDTFGHQAGDDLLKSIASRLQCSVRGSDTVARLAGDEFTVILEALGSVDDAMRVAQTLVDVSRRTIGAGGRTVTVSASVGVAMCRPGESSEGLLHRADEALYLAKRAGRNRHASAEEDTGVRTPRFVRSR